MLREVVVMEMGGGGGVSSFGLVLFIIGRLAKIFTRGG
jgi:hypothetical protein